MRFKAWDKVRKDWIPPEDIAVTGDGHILIRKNESVLLAPPRTPSGDYAANPQVPDSSVKILIEDDTPVRCHRCGWIGKAFETIVTYTQNPKDPTDVIPETGCPRCSSDKIEWKESYVRPKK